MDLSMYTPIFSFALAFLVLYSFAYLAYKISNLK